MLAFALVRKRLVPFVFGAVFAQAPPAGAFVWPNAVERIEQKLKSHDPGARRQAAQRLRELPQAAARRLLPQALADPDAEVRLTAAEAALELRVAGLGALVVPWLNDPERRVRLAAAELLRSNPAREAIAPLGRVLGDPDTAVRTAAAHALGASGSKEAGVPLLGHLDDPDPNVRRAVVLSLARLGDRRAVVPLIGKIQDARPNVRRAVARSLGRLGDARAASALILALRDSEESVRVAALEALGELKDKSATLSVIALLKDEERAAVRAAALNALASIGSNEGLEALVRELESEDPELDPSPVRSALAKLGERAVSRLLTCLAGQPSPALGDGCARALAETGSSKAPDAIADALRRNVVRPRAGLRALGELGKPSSLPVVLEHLTDPDAFVRKTAIDAAAALLDPSKPDGRALEPIVKALEAARSSRQERAALLSLLGRTGSPRAVPLLAPLAEAADDEGLRLAALEALGLLGAAGQDRVLLVALEAEEPSVRLAAALALRRVASGASARILLDRLERAAEQDRAALALALGGALSRSRDKRDLERAERLMLTSRGGERDALIEAVGRMPAATPRLAALAERSPDVADRSKIAEALAGSEPALAALVSLAKDQDGSVRANAVWALGGVGRASELRVLVGALADRDVAVAGNAAAALGRAAARTRAPVGEPLCRALADSRSYVRANALGGLRLARTRCKGSEERALLARDASEVVRSAAAELVAGVPSSAPAEDAALLERCADEDPSGAVASACTAVPARPSNGTEPVSVFVIPSGESSPAPRVAFALVRADGLMRLGVTDRRGSVFEADAPRGWVSLAVPAPLTR